MNDFRKEGLRRSTSSTHFVAALVDFINHRLWIERILYANFSYQKVSKIVSIFYLWVNDMQFARFFVMKQKKMWLSPSTLSWYLLRVLACWLFRVIFLLFFLLMMWKLHAYFSQRKLSPIVGPIGRYIQIFCRCPKCATRHHDIRHSRHEPFRQMIMFRSSDIIIFFRVFYFFIICRCYRLRWATTVCEEIASNGGHLTQKRQTSHETKHHRAEEASEPLGL